MHVRSDRVIADLEIGYDLRLSLRNRNNFPRQALAITAAASVAFALSGCGGSGTSETKSADSKFPAENITLTVQAAAGGGSDLASRAIAKVMEKDLGVSVVVENRPGASGSTAIKYVAGQDPDGYHIGFVPVEIAMFDHLGLKVPPSSIDYLGEIMIQPGTIAVPVDSPYKTLTELMAAAKTKQLTVANSGAGSAWEVATKLLGDMGGVTFTPVPFDGGAPAVTAAMGAKVDAVVAGSGETHTGAESGKLRVLAIFSPEAHPVFTDIPTAKSEGIDLTFGGWGGIYAPKGLPADVKATLEKAVKDAAQSPAFTDVVTPNGTVPEYKSSADFTTMVNSEYQRFGKVLGN